MYPCFTNTVSTEKGIGLYPIDISGKRGSYAFDKGNAGGGIKNWRILFPEREMEGLKRKEIKKRLFLVLMRFNRKLFLQEPLHILRER